MGFSFKSQVKNSSLLRDKTTTQTERLGSNKRNTADHNACWQFLQSKLSRKDLKNRGLFCHQTTKWLGIPRNSLFLGQECILISACRK